MRNYSAVRGVQPAELPLFDKKVRFLTRDLDPNAQTDRFTRVLRIAGLPDLQGALAKGGVDVPKLVDVVKTQECQAFRDWLRSVDTADDAEIEERVNSVTERLKTAVHSPAGKAVRVGISTVASLIPPVGLVAGPTVSMLDPFLLKKLVPLPGPTAFLSRLYPSVSGGWIPPAHRLQPPPG